MARVQLSHFPAGPTAAWIASAGLLLAIAAAAPASAQQTAAEQPLQREQHSAEQQMRFAEGLLARAFHDMAEKELRYFLDQYSTHELAPQAMFRLVEALRAQDKTDATLSAINQFHASWPQHDLAMKLFLVKGEMLLRMERFEQAQSAFRQLLISADSSVREAATYFLAQSQARQGKIDLALDLYKRIASEPFDAIHQYRPYALFAIASAQQHSGKLQEADAAFRRLSHADHVPASLREEALYRVAENAFLNAKFQAAITTYEELLVEFPDSTFAREARKRRVWAHFSLDQHARAAELAAEWRRRYPDADDYEMDYIHGAALAGNGFAREALPYFERVRDNVGAAPEFRRLGAYQLVFNLLRSGQLDRVSQAATVFLTNFPDAHTGRDIRYFAAEAQARQASYDQAATQLREALNRAPKTWQFYWQANKLLADCYRQQKLWKQAAVLFRRLAAEVSSDQQPHQYLLLAADCEHQQGDITAAIADYERIRRLYGDQPEVLRLASLRLAELYAGAEQYDQAEAVLRHLLSQANDVSEAQVVFFLGYLHFRQAKFAQAETFLRQALNQSAGAEITRNSKYYLAGTLLELQREPEALELFGQLLVLPVELRPVFPPDLLFRLADLYYNRNAYETGEAIYRWLTSWTDPEVSYRGGLGLARLLLAQNKATQAEAVLEPLLAAQQANNQSDSFAREEISSLLGEVYLLNGQNDRAVMSFERALARPGLDKQFAVRARWGLAAIFFAEERLNQALHYAINGFILGDDPTYTPRTMWLAVQILDRQDKPQEAWTTWQELHKRYTAFAQQYQQNPLVQKLAAAVPPPQPNQPSSPTVPQ